MIPLFSPPVAAWVYAALCAATLILVKEKGWETIDRGGYKDSLWTKDKAQHFGISLVLAFMAPLLLGVSLLVAALITFGAGLAWELLFCDRWSHRWRDLIADGAGVALAVLLLWLGASVR